MVDHVTPDALLAVLHVIGARVRRLEAVDDRDVLETRHLRERGAVDLADERSRVRVVVVLLRTLLFLGRPIVPPWRMRRRRGWW